jgi:RHS repeat-associated protein
MKFPRSILFAFCALGLAGSAFADPAPPGGAPSGNQPSTANPQPKPPDCPEKDCPPEDPVVLSGGKFYYPILDVEIPGLGRAFGVNLHFFRGYSNMDDAVGVLGRGWCTTLDSYLGNAGGSVPFFRHETGRVIYFTQGSSILFPDGHTGPGWQDQGFTLETLTGGDYEMTETNGVKYRFTATGAVGWIEDPLGHRLTFGRDAFGRTTSITDHSGRKLTFTYAFDGKLTSVTDPLGRVWGYGYHIVGNPGAGMLAGVQGPAPLNFTESYQYNSFGNMGSVTNARGLTTSYTYDTAMDRVTRMTHPDGKFVDFTYNNFLGTSSMTDEDGKIWQYEYVGPGLVSNVIDPLNAVHHYQYNSAHELVEYRGPLYDPITAQDRRMTYTWLDHNNTQITDETGAVKTFGYDPANHEMLSEADDNGHTVTITKDASRRVSNVQDAMGKNTSYTYDAATGLLKTITDRRLKTTTLNYDMHGNRTSVVDAAGQTWTAVYDAVGRQISRTNPLGHTTTYTWDAADRVTRQTDAAGKFWDYTYDQNGNLLTQKTPLASTTSTYTYDARDRLLTARNPLNHTTTYTYNGRGLVTSEKDPLNRITTFEYDATGRRIKMTQPAPITGGAVVITQSAYNLAGELISVTDDKGQITQFSYDPALRRSTGTFPDATTEISDYDGSGNLISYTNRSGNVALKTYNANDWLIVQNCPTCGATFAYDDEGNPTQVVDANAGTYSYTYDNLNRVLTSVQPGGTTGGAKTVGYTYDTAGRPLTLTYPDGTVVTYSHDAVGRMTALSPTASGGGGSYGFTYDNAGRRTALTFPNAATGTYTYDTASRLLGLTWNTSAPALLASQTYVFNANSDITSTTATNGLTGTRTYGYDQHSRLISRTTTGALNTGYGAATWTLDSVGNRISTSSGGGSPNAYTLKPNQLNQYATVGSSTLSYDTRGNLTADGTRTLAYDADNRLKQATLGAATVDYTYDFAHRLAKRTQSGSSVRYLYDQNWNVLAEINGSTGATNVLYLHGPSVDEVVAEVRSAGSNVNYLLKDHLGSTTAIFQPGSGITQRYTYDEYGAVQVRDASGNPTSATPSTRYLFTGREFDAVIGIYNYRHRWFHPGIGRFVSADPIGFEGGDVNIYSYVANNPALLSDHLGLISDKDEAERKADNIRIKTAGTKPDQGKDNCEKLNAGIARLKKFIADRITHSSNRTWYPNGIDKPHQDEIDDLKKALKKKEKELKDLQDADRCPK